ncbi:MAG: aldo/keto reductase [Actinobacteria bacterium]|nr:aldo/keto reductase [Actinomycetota bacterium]
MAHIGTSDLEVTPLCLGGNVFGWTADVPTSEAILDAFTAGGGNFIDTADGYSQWAPGHSGGESETVIGNWMASRRNRDDLVIATKVGFKTDRAGLRADNIRVACDESLQRLHTDHIDLYYCHFDDPDTPLVETMSALAELVQVGKVRYLAASNYSAERLQEALDVSDAHGFPRFVAMQPHYNLLERDVYEGALANLCTRENISCVPYYSLAAGFLTGKYRTAEAAAGAPREGRVNEYLNDRAWRVLAAVDAVAAAHNTSNSAVAIAWLRLQATVTAPIASATKVAHVADLLASVQLDLAPEDLRMLADASRK